MSPGKIPDHGLEILLALHGVEMVLEYGYWIRFQVWAVNRESHIPHGIRYSLTLHDAQNKRLVGFDNAHAVKGSKKKFAPRATTWDHQHHADKVLEYRFESAEKLLIDFWEAVYKNMNRTKQ